MVLDDTPATVQYNVKTKFATNMTTLASPFRGPHLPKDAGETVSCSVVGRA